MGDPQFIIAMIPKESVIIQSLGALSGIGINEVVRSGIVTVFPTLQVATGFNDLFRGCIAGLAAGTSVAVYHAYKVARTGRLRALSY